MEIQSRSHLNLVSRSLNRGWLDGQDDRRKQAVESILAVVETSDDPEMKVKAFQALIRADQADLKREEVAIKKQEADDNRRLRLLEFARSLPVGEIDRIASEHKAGIAER
tara:strand:+ start:36 stop:365 length:330 start_codon:yes stop_codon:yes gene_type:complete